MDIIQLANAINTRAAVRAVRALAMSGQRYDCGSKIGYLEAVVDFALDQPGYSARFKALLAKRAGFLAAGVV